MFLAAPKFSEKYIAGWNMSLDKYSQNIILSSGKFENEKNYWLTKLSGDIVMSSFPLDYPRPELIEYRQETFNIKLRDRLSQKLFSVSNNSEYAIFMLLLAGVKYLLTVYTGNEDVIVGMPIFKQKSEEAVFINNTIALRTIVDDGMSFKELLSEVRCTVSEAVENQNYPFYMLPSLLKLDVDNKKLPILNTMVLLENIHDTSLDTEIKPDTAFYFRISENNIELKVLFNAVLFQKETISRITAHLENILEQALINPEIPLAEFNILSEQEKIQLVEEFNETGADYPRNKTIHQLFEEQVEKTPNNTAVVFSTVNGSVEETNTLTYSELNEKANQLARVLRNQGVKRDSLVAIVVERSVNMIICILGILKAGGAYLPIDPDYPADRINYIINESNAAVLLTQKKFAEKIGFSKSYLNMEDPGLYQGNSLNLENTNNPDSLAYVIYTSGTTGKPKGAMITHRNVVRLMVNDKNLFDFDDRDVWTMFHSFCFDFSVWEMYGALLYGGKLIIVPKLIAWDSKEFLKLLKREKVTVLNQTPTAFYSLASEEMKLLEKELSIRYIIFGGEALKPVMLKGWRQKYPGTRLINMYGITETTVHVTYKEVTDRDIEMNISNIGKPIPTLTTYVMNKHMKLLPVGVAGELYVGGEGVCRGYLNNPELTDKKFVENPYKPGEKLYKSGDLVKISSNGDMEYLGRIDHQVKIRGFRIELGEIETHLLNHKLVTEVFVALIEDSKGSKHLCAYFVSGQNVKPSELRDYLTEKIPQYMVPSYFIQIPKMPVTVNGKIDRKILPKPFDNLDTGVDYTPPTNEIEETIVRIWQEILGIERIGIQDNFFELGGHSISLMQIIARIDKVLGVKVSFTQFIDNSTVSGIAALVTAGNHSTKEVMYGSIRPQPEDIHIPFPLTNVQTAYLIGRDKDFEMGGVSAHAYAEIETSADIKRLEQSLQSVIKRHPMLRSIILPDGTQQVLEEVPEYEISVTDISHLNSNEQESFLEKETNEMSHRVFEPDKWPLFEFKAFRISTKLHLLCIGFDAIIADAASLQTMGKELMDYYHNPNLQLPELEFSFRDYVLAWEEFKQSETYKADRAYWLNKLDSFPLAPVLPLKQEPSAIEKPQFKRLSRVIGKEEWEGLKKESQKYGITPSALICTVYAKTLAFWSNQPHHAINLTVFNRYPFNKDVNSILGDFTSLILLEIDFQPDCSFWDSAKQVQKTLLESLEHRHYDGIEFIRELAKFHNMRTQAIMPVVFTSVLFNDGGNQVEGWQQLGKIKTGISQTSQVYLDNQASEEVDGLYIDWDYVDGLFDEDVITSMFEHYINILTNLVGGQKSLKLLPPSGDRVIIEEYNLTDEEIPPATLHGMFIKQAATTPDNIAVISQDGQLTYRELHEKSNQVARYLLEKGVGTNDLIGLIAHRCPETIINVMGILKAGAAYVPVDPEYPEERKQYILSNSGCKFILEPGLYLDENLSRYSLDDLEDIINIDDLAYVIYTSGSTGRPKGVMITHRAVTNTIVDINNKFNVNEHDRIPLISSICFDLSVYDIFGSLSVGAAIILISDQRDVTNLINAIQKNQITIWNSVPAIMDMVVDALGSDFKNESLRAVLLSGDWIPMNLPVKIRKYFARAEVVSLGGATEGSIWSIYYPIRDIKDQWKSIPYGMPLANQKFYVLNYEMDFCPLNVQGELYIGGVGVARGYINDEEKTINSFINHSALGYVYKTGDYGVLRKEGYIEFLGRKDQQVKIKGYRIELGEIETRLLLHAEIKNAVVIDRSDTSGKKYLCAYIVTERNLANTELREYLMKDLPDYMIPSFFVRLETIPLNSNGKVDRRSLPEPTENIKKSLEYQAPRNETEEELAIIWAELLGVEEIGINDDFFELGGDSLKAQQLANRIDKRFEIRISIRNLFEHQTIAKIADLIMNGRKVVSKTTAIPQGDTRNEKYFWSPSVHWEKVNNEIKISDSFYSGVALEVFPELYFRAQNRATLDELLSAFPSVDNNSFAHLLDQLIENKVLVCSLLTPEQIFYPQKEPVENTYGDEILYDIQAFTRFRNEQLNRSLNYCGQREIMLDDDAVFPSFIMERRSYRVFDEKTEVTLKVFSHLMSSFRQNACEGNVRYYYASAGGLYPIDIYIYVKAGRVEGLNSGLYYYDPVSNSLHLVSENAAINEDAHYLGNKQIFTSSAFSIFFIYNSQANMPKYGGMGYYFACIDSGIMIGLLTQVAEMLNLGLCSIGDMNFNHIKEFFRLNKNQVFLHAVEVGLKPKEILGDNFPENDSSCYPASSAQKRLFILQQIMNKTTAYNGPSAVMLEGELDKDRIEQVFKKLIARHESLRTSFYLVNGEAVQRIQRKVELPFEYREADIGEIMDISKEFIKPFDLSEAPLLRVLLVKLPDGRHLLLVDIHHIAADKISSNILIKEMMDLYEGRSIPKLKAQYKDYTLWQNTYLKSNRMKEQEEYWLKIFSGDLPILNLPADYPRPAVQSFEGDLIEFETEEVLLQKLKEVAALNGSTLFMIILAAYNILLSRYSGQEDIIVGSPIAGRLNADFENTVGMFTNTLAFRNYPGKGKTFAEFLKEVKENTLKAYENQDYQFEELIEKLGIQGDLSRNPLFDTMFVLQNMQNQEMKLYGLKASEYDLGHNTSKFDIHLEAEERKGKLKFNMEYSTKLFKQETMESFSRDLLSILNAITEDKDIRISNIKLENEMVVLEKAPIKVDFKF